MKIIIWYVILFGAVCHNYIIIKKLSKEIQGKMNQSWIKKNIKVGMPFSSKAR